MVLLGKLFCQDSKGLFIMTAETLLQNVKFRTTFRTPTLA